MGGSTKGISRQKPAHTRFLNKVILNKESLCWEWLDVNDPNEYPKIKVNGKSIKASHYSYKTYIGELPIGLIICHKCDNPRCASPFHLFAGTHKENMQDSRDKGRRPDGAHPSQKSLKAGCKCTECKMLAASINKSKWIKLKQKLGIKSKTPPIHGSNSMYANKKCRCELCIKAHSEASADYRRRKKLVSL